MRSLLIPMLFTMAVMPRSADAELQRPNIIFLLTDDQRIDTLGCYGASIVNTPHIDRLAADGVLFENAFVTSAICTPSRVCYFLGQYERRHGVNFNSGTALAPEAWEESYPLLLRKAGYFTGYVGKNHVPIGARGYASGIIEHSFDFWYAAHQHLTFYPKRRHPIFRDARADTQIEILQEGAISFLDPEHEFITGAEAFLKSRPADRPFCLSIAYNLPHAAGTSSMELLPSDPPVYRTLYRDRLVDIPLPPHYVAKAAIVEPKLPPDVLYAQFRQSSYDYVDTEAALRERMVREFQTVTGIDRMLGALRAKLSELELADNTVIVFASDHGIMHGEYGLGGKALNYEPCLRTPLIVLDPRLPARHRGRRVSALALSIDIAPTLLELAGVDVPEMMQGRSLVPLLSGDAVGWRKSAFAENLWSTVFGNPRVESVRTAEWKYIRYFATDRSLFVSSEGPAAYGVTPAQAQAYRDWLTTSVRGLQPDYEELFHIASDPHESKNLAGDPRYEQRLQELRLECDRLVREAKGGLDTGPLTVPLEPEPRRERPRKKPAKTR